MKFGMQNIWLGNEESLNRVMNLNAFMSSPTQDAKAFFGYDDDDDEEPRFDGIGSRLIQVEDSVGIIRIDGSLTNRYSVYNRWFGVISYDEIRDALVSLAGDTEIGSILLEIDTGGGAAHGVNEVAELISKVDKIKPVEAHTSMYTFSAGMWLASSARKISAAPISEVGSIGVIITMASYHEMYKKAGIDVEVIRAGKYKALGNPSEPISEAAKKEAEEKADKLYGYFLDQMVRGRPKLSIATKDAWAEGKTFFADEAILIGLIDEIESFDKVVATLSANYDNTNSGAQYSAANPDNSTLSDGDPMGNKTAGKTVLNEEALAAAALGAPVAAEEVVEEEQTSEETGTEEETSEEETSTEEQEEGTTSEEASAPTGSMDMSAFVQQITEMSAKNAKLEEQLAQANSAREKAEASASALKPIAAMAVNRLEIALGKGVTSTKDMNASTLADLHAELNTSFETAFSIGGPKSERLAEGRESATNVDNSFCTIHKPNA